MPNLLKISDAVDIYHSFPNYKQDAKKNMVYCQPSKHSSKYSRQPYNRNFPAFTTTKFEPKTGIEINTDAVRTLLNKLTNKNYIDMVELIVKEIELIAQMETEQNCETNSSTRKIGDIIFDIASNNRFYSETYAELYCELIRRYPDYNTILLTTIESLTELFSTIRAVDPNEDYDLFCQNNKLNETRKSLAAFFVNLMKNGLVQVDTIVHILHILLVQVNSAMMDPLKKSETYEIFETVSILFKHVQEQLIQSGNRDLPVGDYNSTREFIQHITTVKT